MNRHPLLDLDRFDLLPSPPSGWHDYDYRLLDDGRLALVRVSTDLAAISPHDLARAWTKTRLRLSCFDGEAESDVLELPPVRWPKVDRLPDGRWLVVESRCSWSARNVSIFNSDGTRAESFSVGDSVGPVLYLPDGRLWVGYMDQAIFGDDPPGHPARSGLAAFDRSGACVWRFAHETYRICDCYALGATGTVLWAYTYVDFPLIRVNGEEVRMWRSSVDGVHAIAVNDSDRPPRTGPI